MTRLFWNALDNYGRGLPTTSASRTAYSTSSESSFLRRFARSNPILSLDFAIRLEPHCRTCDSSTFFYLFTYFTSKFLDMPHQLPPNDKKVVKRWWKCGYEKIDKLGYYLESHYSPSPNPSHLPENSRGFREIASTGVEISAMAIRKSDDRWCLLTLVPPSAADGNGQDTQYLTVDNRGSHILKVTPLSAYRFFHRIFPWARPRTSNTN